MGKRVVPGEEWRVYMEGTHRNIHRAKRTPGALPSDSRCRFCHVPFAGAGGWVARHLSLKGHELDALVIPIDERPGVSAGLDA